PAHRRPARRPNDVRDALIMNALEISRQQYVPANRRDKEWRNFRHFSASSRRLGKIPAYRYGL
ncbi:hypothetical protein WEI85_35580, partial [Actinomycetes bacterium KLBMP 9797]